jgi:hypothetical protein
VDLKPADMAMPPPKSRRMPHGLFTAVAQSL